MSKYFEKPLVLMILAQKIIEFHDEQNSIDNCTNMQEETETVITLLSAVCSLTVSGDFASGESLDWLLR